MWCTEQFHTQQEGIELYLQQTATSLTQTVIFLIHNHHLCSSWHNSNRDQRFICPSPSTRVPLRINCMFVHSKHLPLLFLEPRDTWSIRWSLTVRRNQSCRFRPNPGGRSSPNQSLPPRMRPSTAPWSLDSWRKLR